jgi:predicted acyltransferase
LLNIIISAFLIYLVRKPIDLYEKFVQNSLLIGIFFLLIGLFVEPLQGGIKKDPATYSYLLLTTGLAIQTLISLLILVDYYKKDKYFKILINNGKNPLMA